MYNKLLRIMHYSDQNEHKTVTLYKELYTVLDPLGNSHKRGTFYFANHKIGFRERYKRADHVLAMLREYAYIELTNYNV